MNGGWISIARFTSSGLSPTPSAGVTGLRRKGCASSTAAIRKTESTTPQTAVACGSAHPARGIVRQARAAMNSGISQVQNSSDPDCAL